MKYWIIIGNVQKGPMTLEELASQPGVDYSTPVWHEGLADWTTAGALPEVTAAIASRFQQNCAPQQPYGQQPYNQPYGQQAPCGQQAYFSQPSAPQMPGQPDAPKMPSNYLALAIITTICCCIPTGIVAIIYASKVSPAYMRGDYAAAAEASSKAELWVIISFVAGLIWAPFSVIFSAF